MLLRSVLGKLITGTYDWTELARSAASGHIGTLIIWFDVREVIQKTQKEDLKAVWEIAEKLEFVGNGDGIAMGGGRGGDPKTSWEEAYQTFLG